jgi:hypothetical protein
MLNMFWRSCGRGPAPWRDIVDVQVRHRSPMTNVSMPTPAPSTSTVRSIPYRLGKEKMAERVVTCQRWS